MKRKFFWGKDIALGHPAGAVYDTDRYYAHLANDLLDSFRASDFDFGEYTSDIFHRGALVLACYMEDIVADSGTWRTFSDLCQQMFGYPVPLFHDDEEYYADEPSLSAVRYLLWSVVSEVTNNIVFTSSNRLLNMADVAYGVLNDAFEEAPIADALCDDVHALLLASTMNFDKLRSGLKWLYAENYLTRGIRNNQLLQEQIDKSGSIDALSLSVPMRFYHAFMHCIFAYRIGPLALYPKDFLAALMRTQGMMAQAAVVERIEVRPMMAYRIDSLNSTRVLLTSTAGDSIEVDAHELNLPANLQNEVDGCVASFVLFDDAWRLNGLLMPMSEAHKKWHSLQEKDPHYVRPGTATLTSKEALKRTRGEQIAYFADGEQLKEYLNKKIKFPKDMLGFVDERGGELPTLFIDVEDDWNALHFFFGYSPSIADPSNPFYDPVQARHEATNLLWDAESVTTHAVHYLLDHDFLPDVYADEALFPPKSSHQTKRADIEFLLRFWRRENY